MENETSNPVMLLKEAIKSEITYKPLDKTIIKKGFTHIQLFREGDFAIYWKFASTNSIHSNAFDAGYEVIRVHRHDGYELGDVKIGPAETYPSDSQWGDMAWSFRELLPAYNRWKSLVSGKVTIDVARSIIPHVDSENGIVPFVNDTESEETAAVVVVAHPVRQGQGHRGRPRKTALNTAITFPVGEFTMQQITDLNKIPKPNMYILIQGRIQTGEVKIVRRESRGKGRPTCIYTTVENPSVLA